MCARGHAVWGHEDLQDTMVPACLESTFKYKNLCLEEGKKSYCVAAQYPTNVKPDTKHW